MSSADTRPEWDQYFIDIAWAVSKRATCPSRKVGAVLVDPITHSIKTTGYNGTPRGIDHCPDHKTASPLCVSLHAETNILINAAASGISTRGSWLYLTCTPCIKCAPLILNAGIERVICDEPYRDPGGADYLRRLIDVKVFRAQNWKSPFPPQKRTEIPEFPTSIVTHQNGDVPRLHTNDGDYHWDLKLRKWVLS
jgi:dCMP deaminase